MLIPITLQGDRYALLVVVPRSRDGLTRLTADLPSVPISEIQEMLQDEELQVSLPSFYVETTTKPVAALAKVWNALQPDSRFFFILNCGWTCEYIPTLKFCTICYSWSIMQINGSGLIIITMYLCYECYLYIVVIIINNRFLWIEIAKDRLVRCLCPEAWGSPEKYHTLLIILL